MTKQTWTPGLTRAQAATLAAFIKSGRVAHFYPRNKTISCNGFPQMAIPKAVEYMDNCLRRIAGTESRS